MARRQMTEEQKEKMRQNLAKARAARKANKEKVQHPEPLTTSEIAPEQPTTDLIKQILELKDNPLIQAIFAAQPSQQQSGPAFNNQGKLVGTVEKYVVDPKYYPNPVERLMKEPRLAPFAFEYNYEIEFEVTASSYETKDGQNMREPKFTVEVRRIILDDEGEQTNGRYIVRRMVFHEDPQAAIVIANEQGIPVNEANEKEFLDEMRYLRVRDWLLGIFYPPKPQAKQKRREMVINGRVVDFFEINSENSETIPFGKLKSKV